MHIIIRLVAISVVLAVSVALGLSWAQAAYGAECPWADPRWCETENLPGHWPESVKEQVVSGYGPGQEPPAEVAPEVVVSTRNGTRTVPAEVVEAVSTHVPDAWERWTYRMMNCESGFDPLARNGSHVGLAQHALRYLQARLDRFVPGATIADYLTPNVDIQVRVTEGLRTEQGTTPWAASRGCWR